MGLSHVPLPLMRAGERLAPWISPQKSSAWGDAHPLPMSHSLALFLRLLASVRDTLALPLLYLPLSGASPRGESQTGEGTKRPQPSHTEDTGVSSHLSFCVSSVGSKAWGLGSH